VIKEYEKLVANMDIDDLQRFRLLTKTVLRDITSRSRRLGLVRNIAKK